MIGAIAELDADVTSIEAARSKMEVLDDQRGRLHANGVGPVSRHPLPARPRHRRDRRIPFGRTRAVDPRRLWVNPDCGLKTRGTEEVVASPDQPRRGHRTGPRRAVARSGVRVTGPETWSARKLTRLPSGTKMFGYENAPTILIPEADPTPIDKPHTILIPEAEATKERGSRRVRVTIHARGDHLTRCWP